jgi:hypothetical protein
VIVYAQGDTSPDLVIACVEDEQPLDLNGVLSITLDLRKPSGAIVSKVLTADAPSSSGLARCTWAVGDLDEAGIYRGEVKIVRNGPLSVEHAQNVVRLKVRGTFTEVTS